MIDTALKPCPFCGGSDVVLVDSELLVGKFVVCNDCCVDGPCRGTPETAIAAWNRRSLAPPTEAEVGAAAKVLYNARQEGLTSEGRIPWGNAHKVVRDEFVDDARAALVAFVAGRNGG